MPDAQQLSAEVILHPADPAAAAEPITSATVAGHAPPHEAVAALTRFFGARGFDVGPLVAISFSISGSRASFRALFGPDLPTGREGSLELDLADLPADLRRHVRAVSFAAPPDFGPGSP